MVLTSALTTIEPKRSVTGFSVNWRQLAVAVLLSVVLGAANFILFLWLAVHKLIPPPVVYSPGLLLGLGLIQVPLEEFIFRGLLLRYIARVNWLLGLLVSSAAFALVHAAYGGLRVTLVSQFVIGLFYGALYLRSRSILITSAAHYTFNVAGRVAMWLIVGV
jgi:membrane protease YdiL (CAAX protease family)